MKNTFKFIMVVLTIVLLFSSAFGCNENSNSPKNTEEPAATAEPAKTISWRADTTGKYRDDDNVTSLICVEATEGTNARVLMFEKSKVNGKNVWTLTLECDGYIGKNGLGKTKEGDSKTPQGEFSISSAFGIKENPGTKLEYIDITSDTYCCGDDTAYNKFIDIKEYPHQCSDGEHMIEYTPEYNYGFVIDYNKDCVKGLGSAIFFHCKGANTYTGGCVAVDEENVVKILKTIDSNTKIIIDYAPKV